MNEVINIDELLKYKAQIQKTREITKKWAQNDANKAKQREYKQKYYSKNKETNKTNVELRQKQAEANKRSREKKKMIKEHQNNDREDVVVDKVDAVEI